LRRLGTLRGVGPDVCPKSQCGGRQEYQAEELLYVHDVSRIESARDIAKRYGHSGRRLWRLTSANRARIKCNNRGRAGGANVSSRGSIAMPSADQPPRRLGGRFILGLGAPGPMSGRSANPEQHGYRLSDTSTRRPDCTPARVDTKTRAQRRNCTNDSRSRPRDSIHPPRWPEPPRRLTKPIRPQ
jgi:hypothetical protein